MADEIGELCEKCSAVQPPEPPAVAKAPPLYRAPLTWSLIALNLASYIVFRGVLHESQANYAEYGPAVLSGAWWMLFTSLFIHAGPVHLLDNMFALWLFGRRAERILGIWTALAVYLAAGLTGGIVSLAAYPERWTAGASAAIIGLFGVVFIAYARRYLTLTTRQRWKFWPITLWMSFAFLPGKPRPGEPGMNRPAHLGGLAAGVLLGYLFTSPKGARKAFRVRTFACTTVVLSLAAVAIRVHDAYVVHLEAAERALERGDETSAMKELKVASAMRPHSQLAETIDARIALLHPPPIPCVELFYPNGIPMTPQEVCKDMNCDGQRHTWSSHPGPTVAYEVHVDTPTFCSENGEVWKMSTVRAHVEMTDMQGKPVCSTDWKGELKDKWKGRPKLAGTVQATPLPNPQFDGSGRNKIGLAECAK